MIYINLQAWQPRIAPDIPLASHIIEIQKFKM